MTKIDYKKTLKQFYQPGAKKVEFVEIPAMNFLMIDGIGDPNTSQSFKEAVEGLFSFSYTLKFMIKKGVSGIDYAVMPLEGLWWADDMEKFSITDKSAWKWTLMIMQPEFIQATEVRAALQLTLAKKDQPALHQIRFEAFQEGRAAQIMHIGPFSAEGPTIEKVHLYIKENGYQLAGKHHEIYLSDIRKGNPANWKTIIRQPYK
jgi:hypothetical protein